jgi:HAD superfamily hydrolase (TIGR01549 family)
VVFDLDGTLLDSDDALAAAFMALGVPAADVTFGHVVADECARLGIDLEEYVARYDITAAQPYPGIDDVVASLGDWAVCSNKRRNAGEPELARLGWKPRVAMFAEDFGGGTKSLAPVLDRLRVPPANVLFVGDTAHDRACAAVAGIRFALAAWNPRAVAHAGDTVLATPADLTSLLRPR